MFNNSLKSISRVAPSGEALNLPPAPGPASPPPAAREIEGASPKQENAPKEKPAIAIFDKQAEARSKALIEELGSDDFHSREKATRTLQGLGESFRGDSKVRDLLESTIRTHPDPEVRTRAGGLLSRATHEYLSCQEERIALFSSSALAETPMGKLFLEQKRNEIHDLFVSFRIAPSLFSEPGSTRALLIYGRVFGLERLGADYEKAKDEKELSKVDQTAFAQFAKLQERLKEISDRGGKFSVEQEEDQTYRQIVVKANGFEHRLTLRTQGGVEPIPGSTSYRSNGASVLAFDSDVIGSGNAEDYVFIKRITAIPRSRPPEPAPRRVNSSGVGGE